MQQIEMVNYIENILNESTGNVTNNMLGKIPNSLLKRILEITILKETRNDKTKMHAILNIDLGSKCNLRCKYCYARTKEKEIKEQTISSKTINNIPDFINKYYKKNESLRINFLGTGEPFLKYSKLKEIINLLTEQCENRDKLSFWICTNGTIDIVNQLRELPNKNIRLGMSIECSEKLQNEIRTSEKYSKIGTYKLVKRNIENIINCSDLPKKYKDIWGLMVVHEKSGDLYSGLKFVRKLGISRVQMKPVRDSEISNEYEYFKKIYDQFVMDLINDIRRGELKYLKMILNDIDYLGKFLIRILLREEVQNRCGAGQKMFSIASDGKIYTCDSMIGMKEKVIGDVSNCNIYNNKEICNVKMCSAYRNSECMECWAKSICGGKCYYLFTISKEAQVTECKIKKHLICLAIIIVDELEKNDRAKKEIEMFCNVMRRIRKNGI